MPRVDHFKLRHGPYRTPRFRYGKTVQCQLRGAVAIVGLSDAPIPWPLGKRGRATTLILYGALARAVRRESNQAVARAWGVTGQTVTKWRKALGVPANNAGSLSLRSEMFTHEEWAKRAQRKAWKNARDPVRREKIAAAKRGKPRPQHVVDALVAANTGRPLGAEHRLRLSESHRRRGTRPPAAGVAWTAHEESLLHSLPPPEVAKRTGRTLTAVYMRRRAKGLTRRIGRGR